ncbi:MAG: DMT family transporter [Pseudomonadota bacterium]
MAQDNIRLAVASIVIAVFSLSLGDALIKATSASFPLWQIFVLRSALCLPVLLVVLRFRYPGVSVLPVSAGWTALRSVMLMSMWVAYYAALPNVELSIAAAVYYTLPLFITLLSAALTGDPVGKTGWFAIALGFAGVLLILRPDAGEFNAFALLPLVSAVLYACAMVLTRIKLREENPYTLSLALNVTFVATGLVAAAILQVWSPGPEAVAANSFMLGTWTALGSKEWLAVVIMAAAVLIGSVLSAIAYQSGPSSLVSTFDFSYLAFAALWGALFFAEIPDLPAGVGIAMIAAAGIVAVRRSAA